MQAVETISTSMHPSQHPAAALATATSENLREGTIELDSRKEGGMVMMSNQILQLRLQCHIKAASCVTTCKRHHWAQGLIIIFCQQKHKKDQKGSQKHGFLHETNFRNAIISLSVNIHFFGGSCVPHLPSEGSILQVSLWPESKFDLNCQVVLDVCEAILDILIGYSGSLSKP